MLNIDWHARAAATNLSVRNFINGEYQDCVGDNTINKFAGRNGDLLYRFASGNGSEVEEAVASARVAFKDGRWRNRSLAERAAVGSKLADLVESHSKTFALYECLDVGKPISNALNDDLFRAARSLREAAYNIDKLVGSCGTDQGALIYQSLKPLGVVGGILGWNYPLAQAASKVGHALMTGNSLVLKPSEFTSLSTSFLAELAVEAGVPAGVFNVVHGYGRNVGDALARHMDVDLLSFVGSSATGKMLMKTAGESNMKRLILECGGKSPYIVFDDSEPYLDAVAADIVASAFPNQGALCVAGSRLLVQESIRQKLMPKILELSSRISPQDPLDSDCTFGAIINENHLQKILGYIEMAKTENANLILGGEQVMQDSRGFYLTPTIFDQVRPDHRIAREEIFGPVLSVIGFTDEEEAVKIANDTSYGLAAYAATKDVRRIRRMGNELMAGTIQILATGEPASGHVSIPSEAQRQSGFGVKGGLAGLAAYTAISTIICLT